MAEPSIDEPADALESASAAEEALDDKRPSGIPPEESTARLRFRPPKKSERKKPPTSSDKRPRGLKNITESARLRLQLALEYDDDEEGPRPPGIPHMSTSARQRLELALEYEEDDILPPDALPEQARQSLDPGDVPLDAAGRKLLRSLSRWVAFCGLVTLAIGMLTGLSYITGPASVVNVVVGILASALSVWLLAAANSFRRVLAAPGRRHLLVNGLGLLRTALLLKAILLFSAMVLGCFVFSVVGGLLVLL
ncbi:MAG: hypothetical protein AB8I08_36910 [Sandaracinaceae bacterium]